MASLFGSIPHLLINRIAAQTAYRHGHGRLPCRLTAFSASPRKIIPVKPPPPYRGFTLCLSSECLPLSRMLPFRSPARWKRRACGCWLASFRNRGDGYYHRLILKFVTFVHSLSLLLRSFCSLLRCLFVEWMSLVKRNKIIPRHSIRQSNRYLRQSWLRKKLSKITIYRVYIRKLYIHI